MTPQPSDPQAYGSTRRRIGIACNADTQRLYLGRDDLRRLEGLGEVTLMEYDAPSDGWNWTAEQPEIEEHFLPQVADLNVLILGHGGPRVTRQVLAAAPRLEMIGEIEGDRRSGRLDIEAAHAAGIRVVDTTHASSAPVAEWALALALLGLRQQGRFSDIIAGRQMSYADYKTRPPGRELTGKRVGLIGFGHIGWRLRDLLLPFDVSILIYDPYAPRELADALSVDFAPLSAVMGCDVVVCLVPATAATTGMIGGPELALLTPDAVFVNVARGEVVDLEALVAKARQEEAWFGIDVHDPEPIALDSPLIGLRNVFLSPHIAGNTVEGLSRYFAFMVDEVSRHLTGLEPRAQITDRVLQGRSALRS